MIIPGHIAVSRKAITHLLSTAHQTQPCGVDLTLKRIMTWSTAGTIDFANTQRATAQTVELKFTSVPKPQNTPPSQLSDDNSMRRYIDISPGSYLVEFNEQVDMPLDLMGQILVRSSLFRSGALVHAGVMDSGYRGAVGAMLQVVNPHGLRLLRDAKMAQMVFHQMSEKVEGYKGVYQGKGSV
ncbi:deoxyuridine 5'-triphosphate nucleotidohydrolase [Dendryphion nanum]|uniref:Deoxyuridine 5'-triphosphate nucleotidohydrolase n=1 Tax=Dendryphion nanum TaxID=256645 RepID=A0A9P9DUC6_9PLEO|nr:deoxyuridine 5'-triphosphate nucleotidohydrolase [Dendryphion nanum]